MPHWLGLLNILTASLQRGKTPRPTNVPDMTLKHLMVRFLSWSFDEYHVPLIAITPKTF